MPVIIYTYVTLASQGLYNKTHGIGLHMIGSFLTTYVPVKDLHLLQVL